MNKIYNFEIPKSCAVCHELRNAVLLALLETRANANAIDGRLLLIGSLKGDIWLLGVSH